MIYLPNHMASAFGRIESIVRDEIEQSEAIYRTLAQAVAYVYGAGVPGDIAEFGTMSGRSAVALAVAVGYHNEQYRADPRGTKRALFFDSFHGLPAATSEIDQSSPHVTTRVWERGACRGFSEEEFSKLVSRYLPPPDYDVIPGWFADTVPHVNRPLALLHVDGDLYSSAMDVLDPLFANRMVSEGAMVLFDDWNCNQAAPQFGERRAWGEIVQRYGIVASNAGAYSWGSQRFIVHTYG